MYLFVWVWKKLSRKTHQLVKISCFRMPKLVQGRAVECSVSQIYYQVIWVVGKLNPIIKNYACDIDYLLTSVTQLCQTLWFPIEWSMPSFPVLHYLLELLSIESVMPSNHLVLCFPLLLLPSIFLSIRIFSNELALHIRWPKYWSFSFSISPSVNIQDWFALGLTGLIFLQSKRLSRVFSNITVQKH